MARLEQHKAWDATPHNGEHIRRVVRDPDQWSGILSLVGIRINPLFPQSLHSNSKLRFWGTSSLDWGDHPRRYT